MIDFKKNKQRFRLLNLASFLTMIFFIGGLSLGIHLIRIDKLAWGVALIVYVFPITFISALVISTIEEEFKKKGYDLGILSYKRAKKMLQNKRTTESLIDMFSKRLEYLNFRCKFDCDSFFTGSYEVSSYNREKYSELMKRYERHIVFLKRLLSKF